MLDIGRCITLCMGRVQGQESAVKLQILLCPMADHSQFPAGGIGRRTRNILRQSPILST
jgi:hypothetical protein